MSLTTISALVAILSLGATAMPAEMKLVARQQPAYAQCGGQGFTGSKTCVSGYTCVAQNPYYSQCIPGTGGATTTGTTTTKPTTTTTPTTGPTSKQTTTTTKPNTTVSPTTTKGTTTTATGSSGGASGNPFAGYQFYPVPQYSSEIYANAIPSLTGSLKAAASEVANNVGTFFWMDTADKVPIMGKYLANIEALNKAGANPPYMGQFVVYDLPDRDCAALASNGEYSIANNGLANYEAYIDAIAAQVKAYPDVNIVFIVEPDSLANLVTNLSVKKCSNAASTYKTAVAYALKNLNFKNVAMYMDAGHAGWLGWSANIQPAADLFTSVWKSAGSPASVRGLATNVANYNAWSISTCPSYTQGNSNCDEKRYVNALGPLLTANGFPAHFITDTGRDGVQPTSQQAWGDWCNVKGTGFGIRPTTNTGDAYEDAFVWVKPGGESDGTSDSSATRYDAHCGYSDALTPAPEAGQWFEAYFEQLLKNANPSF